MKRHLFLTGDIGCGKSTAIAAALEGCRTPLGGFLTRRNPDANGTPISFSLETADGSKKAIFLELTCKPPKVHMDVFETLGIRSLQGNILILDEIGGVEVLSPNFWTALENVLRSSVPILGVIKGKNPSDTLAVTLGLSSQYHVQSEKLWDLVTQDENTLVYFCKKYDEAALSLAQQWVREYCL